MMRFMVRYLTLDIDPECFIADYIGKTEFWKDSDEQKVKVQELLQIFPSKLRLSNSLEVYNAIQLYIMTKKREKEFINLKEKLRLMKEERKILV